VDLNDSASFLDGFPHEAFRRFRRESPVFFHEEPGGPGFWVVTKHEDIRTVSRNPGLFSSARGNKICDMGDAGLPAPLMMSLDPPEHGRLRSIVRDLFSPGAIAALEPLVRRHAAEALEKATSSSGWDLVAGAADELPMRVLCELLGVPGSDREYLSGLARRLIDSGDPEAGGAGNWEEAAGRMCAYAGRAPRPEALKGLSDAEFRSLFMLLCIAGHETAQSSISHVAHRLLTEPGLRERLAAEPALAASAVEECLRLEPPLYYMRRTAVRDTELRGAAIRAGDKLTLWYASANRDEDVFREPDVFDPARSPNDHLSFGFGEHFCLGTHLARLELRVFALEFASRFRDAELASPPRRVRSNFLNSFKELLVRPAGVAAR
jgi:cytochrome P450